MRRRKLGRILEGLLTGGTPTPTPGTAYHPTALNYGTVTGGSGSGGIPRVGDVLSVTGNTWSNANGTVTYTYQWYRGLDAIGGATNATYTVVTADLGCKLRRMETGTNVKGAWTAYTPFTAYAITTAATTFNIACGTKTRSGFGGFLVGIGRTIASGTGMADWTINAVGEIVPAGAYNNQATFSQSTYTLTLDNAQTITISMIANRADTQYSAANDGNSPHWTQLQYMTYGLTGAGEIILGDSIFHRGGKVNPTSAQSGGVWYLESKASYTGSGRIRIYGYNCGSMNLYGYAATTLAKLDFCDFTFSDTTTTGSSFLIYPDTGTPTTGYGWYDGTCSGNGKADWENIQALYARGADTVQRCTFDKLGTGCVPRKKTGETSGDFLDNIGTRLAADLYNGDWEGSAQKINRNAMWNFQLTPGSHGDFVQHQGFTDGLTHNLGEYAFNLAARNVGTPGEADFQGFYLGFNLAGSKMSGPNIHNNGTLGTMSLGISTDYTDNPTIRYNLALFDPNQDSGQPVTGTSMFTPNGANGAGGTFQNNVSNNNIAAAGGIGYGGQSGSPTFGNHSNISASVANYQAALASYPASPNTTLTSRAAMIARFTPVLNGTLKNGDNTYNGPLLPNGCWNTGEVYP